MKCFSKVLMGMLIGAGCLAGGIALIAGAAFLSHLIAVGVGLSPAFGPVVFLSLISAFIGSWVAFLYCRY